MLIIGLDDRIAANSRHGAHVQRCADIGPSAPDCSVSARRATIAIERRHPDQGRELLGRDVPQFREAGDERPGESRTDALSALQEVCARQGSPR